MCGANMYLKFTAELLFITNRIRQTDTTIPLYILEMGKF